MTAKKYDAIGDALQEAKRQKVWQPPTLMVAGERASAQAAADLAETSLASLATITRSEAGPLRMAATNIQAVRDAWEGAGIELIPQKPATNARR